MPDVTTGVLERTATHHGAGVKVKALMVDLSSNNAIPNLKAHYAAGYRVISIKVSEATGYVWSEGAQLADEWHKLGPDAIVWHYHFARPGSGVAQANYFLNAVQHRWRAGDRLVLDCEVGGVNGVLARAFINRCHAKMPHADGAIYGSPYFLRDAKIVSHHGWVLWLADYASKIAFVPPGFDKVAAWQYTDRATGVPGISGAVDRSTLDASVMPHQHAHKRVESSLGCRPEARKVYAKLKQRRLPVKPSHGDRQLLADLGHEIDRVLALKVEAKK